MEQPGDGHRLGDHLPVPLEERALPIGGGGLEGCPGLGVVPRSRQPDVFVLRTCVCQHQPGGLCTRTQVEVGELDLGHLLNFLLTRTRGRVVVEW